MNFFFMHDSDFRFVTEGNFGCVKLEARGARASFPPKILSPFGSLNKWAYFVLLTVMKYILIIFNKFAINFNKFAIKLNFDTNG